VLSAAFFGGELEHEIGGNPRQVVLNRLDENPGFDAIELGKRLIEQHAMTTQDEDGTGDVLDGH
jgi:hypothetical protein